MNGLIGLFSLSALLLAVSGEFPNLSPSYSFRGDDIQTRDGQVTTGTFIQAIDITRRLVYYEANGTISRGSFQTFISLLSENDDAVYFAANGVCDVTPIPYSNTSSNNPFDTQYNKWDPYAAGTESPAGTFTYTVNGYTLQLTIVNGVPAVFTSTNSFSETVTTVTNFEMPPAFSTFSLPSECSEFTCTACYNSAVSVSISVLLLLTTLLLYLFATL